MAKGSGRWIYADPLRTEAKSGWQDCLNKLCCCHGNRSGLCGGLHPPQGHDLPGPRLAVLPPSSSIFLAACLKYWQRGKQIISRLYFAILKEFTLRMKHQPVKNNKLLQQRRRAFLLSAFSFNKLLWLFKFSLSSQKPSFRWVTSAYKLNERIWESTHFRKVIFKQPLVEAKLTMFPYLELIFFREAQIHWAAGLLNWRWMVIV